MAFIGFGFSAAFGVFLRRCPRVGLATGDLLTLARAAGLVLGLHPALRRHGRRPSRDRPGTRLRRYRIGVRLLSAWDVGRPLSLRRHGRDRRRWYGRLFISGRDRRSREDRRRASPQLHSRSRYGGGIGRHVRRCPGRDSPDRRRRMAACNSGRGSQLLAILPPLHFIARVSRPSVPLGSDGGFTRAIATACSERGFVLLFFGFFVCGFHVAFIQTHLPAYVGDRGLASAVGGWSARTDRPLQHFWLVRRGMVRASGTPRSGR